MKKFALIILALVFFLTACGGTVPTTTEPTQDSNLDRAQDYAALIELISQARENQDSPPGVFWGMRRDMNQAAGAEMDSSAEKSPGSNYSQTNIQVEGVDEADIIKTDGRYLYLVANSRLYLIDAADPAAMRVVSSVSFKNEVESANTVSGEMPLELYLDLENDRLILIVSGYLSEKMEVPAEKREYPEPDVKPDDEETETDEHDRDGEKPAPDQPDGRDTPVSNDGAGSIDPDTGSGSSEPGYAGAEDSTAAPDIYYYYMPVKQYVTTKVFDISDRTEPQMVRQFSQEGYYLTSRKIGTDVYVISNQYNYWFMLAEDTAAEVKPDEIFPSTTEGDVKGDWQTVPADSIAVVPDGDFNNQLVIAALDIADDGSKADVLSMIGSSGIVYASADYLYVAAWQYSWDGEDEASYEVATDLYRFRLGNASVTEAGTGSVPGAIVNQFSMDEHDGYFRIATTTGMMWSRDEENTSRNNVYVLDNDLDIIGQVTGLAPGESIKSVRFMGEMAYVVTFRTVDPLFVLDLSAPTSPKVLGELKIPGYSTYLHPVSDTLLLGFGYDVAELEEDRVVNLGLKVSVFDVSDFANPREVSTISLGGMGSWADVLYNHKSLLYSDEKNLIAFPASLTKVTENIYEYELEFQGLVVLTLDDDNQISLRGRVSHYAAQEKEYYGYDMIYHSAWIEDSLYTISARRVMASDLASLATQGAVTLPGYDEQPSYYYWYGMRTDVAEPAVDAIAD